MKKRTFKLRTYLRNGNILLVNLDDRDLFYACSKKYERQIEEYLISSSNDDREISLLTSQCRKLQNDLDALKEHFESGNEKISEFKRKHVKAEAEMKLWKTKMENEAQPKIDELEDENVKLRSRCDLNEQTLAELEAKIILLKKQKHKLFDDGKQSKADAENEKRKYDEKVKKLKEVSSSNEKLKLQIEDLKNEMESSRRENLLSSNELNKINHENMNLLNQVDLLKKEAENQQSKLTSQAEDLLVMDGKFLDIESQKKKIEIEKDDLILAVDDLEFALEKAKVKIDTLMREQEQIKTEMDQRLDDKESEIKAVVQNSQNQLNSERSKLSIEQKTCSELKRFG